MASWRLWATSVGPSELAYGRLAAALAAGASGVVVDAVEALERQTKIGAHRQILAQTIDDDLSQVVRSLLRDLVSEIAQLSPQVPVSSRPLYITVGLPAEASSPGLAADLAPLTAPEQGRCLLIGQPSGAAGRLMAARLLEQGHDVLIRSVASAGELSRLIEGAAQAIRRADPTLRPHVVALSCGVWPAVQAVARRLEMGGEAHSPLPAATLRWLLVPYIDAFRQARQGWLEDPALAEVTLLLVLEDMSETPAPAHFWRAVAGFESDLVLAPAIGSLEDVRQSLALGLPSDLPGSDEELRVALLGRDLILEALVGLSVGQAEEDGWQRLLGMWRRDRESAGSVQAGALQDALRVAKEELSQDPGWLRLTGRRVQVAGEEGTLAPVAAGAGGWLEPAAETKRRLGRIERLAGAIGKDGFTDLLLLGGAGAGAGAALFKDAFGPVPGGLSLTVLDCAAPQAVARVAGALPGERTLVLVVSPGPGQIQVQDLVAYFQPWVARHLGSDWPQAFVAVTDPGSALAEQAEAERWRAVLETGPAQAGRHPTVETAALVALILAGHDAGPLLAQARSLQEELAAGAGASAQDLCALLLAAARTGRNKVAIYSDGAFARLATWLENEIAQTCGGGEAGLLPVVGEGVRQGYGADRLFISYSQGDVLPLGQLADAGHPTARFQITDPSELGREMVRLQIALAGVSALGDGALPGEFGPNELEAETGRILAAGGQERRATDGKEAGLEQALRAIEKMVRGLGEGSHVRISAYLDENGDQAKAAAEFRGWLAGLTMAPVTFGFALGGLASAGRFHPPRWRSCALVQLLDRSTSTPIPGRGYGFSDLIGAEAKAERTMLERRGRPVVTVELNEFDAAAMSQLVDAARSARRA